jgi:CHASE1-domain containing sensor protein
VLRVGFFIGLLAIIGILVSGLVSYRIYEQEGLIARAALTREIDAHAGLVQERLSEREVLARVSAGAFRPSTAISLPPRRN